MGYSVALGGANAPINQIIDGKKTSTSPGTAVQFSATKVPCSYVEVQALETNTKQVAVGGPLVKEAVASRAGVVLQPGEGRVFYVIDLSELWLDPQVSGEGVGYQVGR